MATLQEESAAQRSTQTEERRTLLARHEAAQDELQTQVRQIDSELQDALAELRSLHDVVRHQFAEACRTVAVEDRPDIASAGDQLRYIGRELARRGLQTENLEQRLTTGQVKNKRLECMMREESARLVVCVNVFIWLCLSCLLCLLCPLSCNLVVFSCGACVLILIFVSCAIYLDSGSLSSLISRMSHQVSLLPFARPCLVRPNPTLVPSSSSPGQREYAPQQAGQPAAQAKHARGRGRARAVGHTAGQLAALHAGLTTGSQQRARARPGTGTAANAGASGRA